MSTAKLVPETYELSGDDAWKTLEHTGRRRLLADAFQRLRFADGFSHARSLALMLAMSALQGIIALVGFAVVLGRADVSGTIARGVHTAAPGPVGDLLTTAIAQAQRDGATHSFVGLAFGAIGWLITTTTAMGQLERGLNRLYGVEKDRASFQKYGRAFLLAISVGVTLSAAVTTVAFGRSFTHDRLVGYVLWPVGLLVAVVSMALLFRLAPRRHMPTASWLAFGSSVAVVLFLGVTIALGAYFHLSRSFGDTYGPLAGVVALLLWALLSAIALFYGAAVAAQLEAARSNRSSPQDQEKVVESEPSAARAVA
jgi:YihY family inner membrane protein